VGGDTSWADREQQARSQGEDKFNSFTQSGAGECSGENRFGGTAPAQLSGGGGFADRFGGGGGGFAGGGFCGRR